MAILHDRQQPRSHIGPSKRVKSTKCAQDRLLYDVIRVAGRAGQPPCKPVRGIQMRQYLRLEAMAPVIHGASCALHSRRLTGLHSSYKTRGASDLFRYPLWHRALERLASRPGGEGPREPAMPDNSRFA